VFISQTSLWSVSSGKVCGAVSVQATLYLLVCASDIYWCLLVTYILVRALKLCVCVCVCARARARVSFLLLSFKLSLVCLFRRNTYSDRHRKLNWGWLAFRQSDMSKVSFPLPLFLSTNGLMEWARVWYVMTKIFMTSLLNLQNSLRVLRQLQYLQPFDQISNRLLKLVIGSHVSYLGPG
jgi:hypothetical protein